MTLLLLALEPDPSFSGPLDGALALFAARVLTWLATYWIHSTLLLGAGLLAARRLRSVWLRERLLRIGMFGGILTASIAGLFDVRPLEAFRFDAAHLADSPAFETTLETEQLSPTTLSSTGPPARRPASRTPSRRPATAQDASPLELVALAPQKRPRTQSAAGSERDDARVASDLVSEVVPGVVLGAGTRSTGASPAPRFVSTTNVLAVVAAVWFLWTLLGVLRLASGWLAFRRSLGERLPLEGRVALDFAALRRTARFYHPVRLTVSDQVPVPVTIGFLRREIVLPRRALAQFDRLELRAILAHELGHTKRRDTIWFLAYAFVERVFVFQPLHRPAHRELLATAELACDDLAVRWTGNHLELASSLTEIARWLVNAKRSPAAVPCMARERSRLGTRVLRLLERDSEAAGRRPLALLFACGGGTLALVAALAPAVRADGSKLTFDDPTEDLTGEPGDASAARLPDEELPAVAKSPVAVEALPDPPVAAIDVGLPSPAAEPAPEPTAPNGAGPAPPFGLLVERELVHGQLDLLQEEWSELRQETLALEVPEQARLNAAFDALDVRLERLAAHEARMNELLDRLFGGEAPDVGGAPRTDVPQETP